MNIPVSARHPHDALDHRVDPRCRQCQHRHRDDDIGGYRENRRLDDPVPAKALRVQVRDDEVGDVQGDEREEEEDPVHPEKAGGSAGRDHPEDEVEYRDDDDDFLRGVESHPVHTRDSLYKVLPEGIKNDRMRNIRSCETTLRLVA